MKTEEAIARMMAGGIDEMRSEAVRTRDETVLPELRMIPVTLRRLSNGTPVVVGVQLWSLGLNGCWTQLAVGSDLPERGNWAVWDYPNITIRRVQFCVAHRTVKAFYQGSDKFGVNEAISHARSIEEDCGDRWLKAGNVALVEFNWVRILVASEDIEWKYFRLRRINDVLSGRAEGVQHESTS